MTKPAVNPTANVLRDADAPFHAWYRFVLSFPAHLVRDYVDRFQLSAQDRVLDPFCGTGTTLVEAKRVGVPSVGIEALPVSHFAAATKLAWDIDSDLLRETAAKVASSALSRLDESGITDASMSRPPSEERLLGLEDERERLLFKDAISPLPLHKTLVLQQEIEALVPDSLLSHMRLALAATAVASASNLRFGPEIGVGKVKPDAEVIGPWLERTLQMADDIESVVGVSHPPASVHLGDAREADRSLDPESVDAVITSPPYPNEKDYSRTVRLESVLLGFMNDRTELRTTKKDLLRSNTRGVYKADTDDQWVAEHEEIQDIADRIERERVRLGKTSGFERLYPRVTRLYFGGMARHFESLKSVLRPGARLAYVVGDQASYLRVMIRTGQLLADIASATGYEVEGIELFRTRMATATRNQLREEVLLLRWPG